MGQNISIVLKDERLQTGDLANWPVSLAGYLRNDGLGNLSWSSIDTSAYVLKAGDTMSGALVVQNAVTTRNPAASFLGAELILNPTFTSDVSWTHNAQWVLGPSGAVYTPGTPATDTLVQNLTVNNGFDYVVDVDFDAANGNYVDVFVGTGGAVASARLFNDTGGSNYDRSVFSFRATSSASIPITINPTGLSSGNRKLTKVSIKRLNAASGASAALIIQDSDGNTAVEMRSGQANGANVFIGKNTGYRNVFGIKNVLIGDNVGTTIVTASLVTSVGYLSGASTTSANQGTYFGFRAGTNITSGGNNVCLGPNTGAALTTGEINTFAGADAGQAAPATSTGNSGFGYAALSTATGGSNAAFGAYAGQTAAGTGVFMGYQAGRNNTGAGNVLIGNLAGDLVSSGAFNVIIGTGAGRTPGSHNVFIGAGAGAAETGSNKFIIQNITSILMSGDFSTGDLNLNAHLTMANAKNIILNTSTGTKIGTATSQKLSLWNATPIVQPTNAVTAAAFVANTSLIADDSATYGGYTMGQVVAALKAIGALA
jgi:hypothetical protein